MFSGLDFSLQQARTVCLDAVTTRSPSKHSPQEHFLFFSWRNNTLHYLLQRVKMLKCFSDSSIAILTLCTGVMWLCVVWTGTMRPSPPDSAWVPTSLVWNHIPHHTASCLCQTTRWLPWFQLYHCMESEYQNSFSFQTSQVIFKADVLKNCSWFGACNVRFDRDHFLLWKDEMQEQDIIYRFRALYV